VGARRYKPAPTAARRPKGVRAVLRTTSAKQELAGEGAAGHSGLKRRALGSSAVRPVRVGGGVCLLVVSRASSQQAIGCCLAVRSSLGAVVVVVVGVVVVVAVAVAVVVARGGGGGGGGSG
jgi:hypothetical protein